MVCVEFAVLDGACGVGFGAVGEGKAAEEEGGGENGCGE